MEKGWGWVLHAAPASHTPDALPRRGPSAPALVPLRLPGDGHAPHFSNFTDDTGLGLNKVVSSMRRTSRWICCIAAALVGRRVPQALPMHATGPCLRVRPCGEAVPAGGQHLPLPF